MASAGYDISQSNSESLAQKTGPITFGTVQFGSESSVSPGIIAVAIAAIIGVVIWLVWRKK